MPKIHRTFTLKEEIANSISHGVGAGLSIVGLTLLVVLAVLFGDVWRIVSFSIYGSTLIFVYLASTLYHGIQYPPAKKIFQLIDHVAIYLLIAGTYTPFLLVNMRHGWGGTLLVIIWGLALLGIGLKIFFINRYDLLFVSFYILMGWLVVINFREMLATIPSGGIVWLLLGGGFYTIGAIFYALPKIPYTHTVWHFFVLGGSICHYFSILFYVLPKV